jgi:hypothetical protein
MELVGNVNCGTKEERWTDKMKDNNASGFKVLFI